MIVFPNSKINIGLHIGHLRTDGYHHLETFFYPLPLTDLLEVVTGPEFQFIQTGLPVPGDLQNNICVRAYRLLKNDYPSIPELTILLHKNIPVGSGLGGGSSDGAFTLQLLNQYGSLGISQDQLAQYALTLGSDCPFFIHNKPCYATGRGEMLEEVSLDLSPFSLVLVHPDIHIDTRWAFSQIKPNPSAFSIKRIVTAPVGSWKACITNDFEVPVFSAHPALADIKEKLYQSGALYASLSGSGSTLYGIYNKNDYPAPALFHPHRYTAIA